MSSVKIVRGVPPTNLDRQPYLTLWKVINTEHDYDLYVQTNPSYANPDWVRLGLVVEKTIGDRLDSELIYELVDAFQSYRELLISA